MPPVERTFTNRDQSVLNFIEVSETAWGMLERCVQRSRKFSRVRLQITSVFQEYFSLTFSPMISWTTASLVVPFCPEERTGDRTVFGHLTMYSYVLEYCGKGHDAILPLMRQHCYNTKPYTMRPHIVLHIVSQLSLSESVHKTTAIPSFSIITDRLLYAPFTLNFSPSADSPHRLLRLPSKQNSPSSKHSGLLS